MAGLISVNGVISAPEDARVSALDRGFLFGDNVFEVIVCFDNKFLDLDRHLTRLRSSAAELALDIPWSDEELRFDLTALAEQVDVAKKYVRLVITRGEGLGLKVSPDIKPNKIVYAFPAPNEPISLYADGVSLKRALRATRRGAAAKTGNYLKSILALQKAEKAGYQDVLWSNSDGEITEATTANIFFMEREGDNVSFVTPSHQSGILMGITRQKVIELLQFSKIPVYEQVIFVDELPKYDEAFICSTVRGLIPVNRIDSHKMHTSRDKAVFRHIQRLFNTWVETQLGHRVDWATGRKL